MKLRAWELNLEEIEAIMLGVEREVFIEDDVTEIDYSFYFLFVRLRLTLIYN